MLILSTSWITVLFYTATFSYHGHYTWKHLKGYLIVSFFLFYLIPLSCMIIICLILGVHVIKLKENNTTTNDMMENGPFVVPLTVSHFDNGRLMYELEIEKIGCLLKKRHLNLLIIMAIVFLITRLISESIELIIGIGQNGNENQHLLNGPLLYILAILSHTSTPICSFIVIYLLKTYF